MAARRLTEVALAFLKLGLVSFGGPVAHLGYFREEFVNKRRWLADDAYADLVALCQFLPGPASSQVVFALGSRRAGWLGGLLASLAFTLPSAVLMILFAYGVAATGQLRDAGWLQGLKLAAVAVVAHAVWGMGRQLCPDLARLAMAGAAAALLLFFPGTITQMAVIFCGGVAGWWIYRKTIPDGEPDVRSNANAHRAALACLVTFFLLLGLLPALASATGNRPIVAFDAFYRAGSLVFGGGHVVLPLLRAEVVPTGWVADDAFLAGYGAAQAVPGPLFTFAAYLGAVMRSGPGAWIGGLWCLLAIFLPAWLLIAGTLPFWQRLRSRSWAQAALRGANSAVVGLLFAALCHPVWTEGVKSPPGAAVAVGAFALLQWRKAPSWLVVLLAAAAGQWLPV